jgi:hypothetical protein
MALPTTAFVNKALPTNPFPLGVSTVAVAGTAVKITGNFTDLDNITAQRLIIEALAGNTGVVYVIVEPSAPPWTLPGGGTTSGADTTTYLNVIRVLAKGETWEVPAYMMNEIRLGQFYVDVATNGDKAIATATFA